MVYKLDMPSGMTYYIPPASTRVSELCVDGNIHCASKCTSSLAATNKIKIHADFKGTMKAKEVEIAKGVKVKGEIYADTVIIQSNASVNGYIDSNTVSCLGSFEGTLIARERLEKGEASKISGVVLTPPHHACLLHTIS